MLAQLADLRLCALMSLRSYVPVPLCPAHLCPAPLCRRSPPEPPKIGLQTINFF